MGPVTRFIPFIVNRLLLSAFFNNFLGRCIVLALMQPWYQKVEKKWGVEAFFKPKPIRGQVQPVWIKIGINVKTASMVHALRKTLLHYPAWKNNNKKIQTKPVQFSSTKTVKVTSTDSRVMAHLHKWIHTGLSMSRSVNIYRYECCDSIMKTLAYLPVGVHHRTVLMLPVPIIPKRST